MFFVNIQVNFPEQCLPMVMSIVRQCWHSAFEKTFLRRSNKEDLLVLFSMLSQTLRQCRWKLRTNSNGNPALPNIMLTLGGWQYTYSMLRSIKCNISEYFQLFVDRARQSEWDRAIPLFCRERARYSRNRVLHAARIHQMWLPAALLHYHPHLPPALHTRLPVPVVRLRLQDKLPARRLRQTFVHRVGSRLQHSVVLRGHVKLWEHYWLN